MMCAHHLRRGAYKLIGSAAAALNFPHCPPPSGSVRSMAGGPRNGKLRGRRGRLSSRDLKPMERHVVDVRAAVAAGYVIDPAREGAAGPTKRRGRHRGRARGPPERYAVLTGPTMKERKEQSRKDRKGRVDVRIDPEDVPRAPLAIRPFVPAIEEYVVNEWLPKYPPGARTRRLRNDLAFRMKGGPSPRKKLHRDIVDAIAAEVARRNKGVELWKNHRGMMKLIASKPEEEEEVEEEEEEGVEGQGGNREVNEALVRREREEKDRNTSVNYRAEMKNYQSKRKTTFENALQVNR